MRFTFTFVFVIIIVFSAFSQDKALGKVMKLSNKGKTEKAFALVEKLIAENPESEDCIIVKHVLQLKQKDIKGAFNTISKGIEQIPSSAKLYSARGGIFHEMKYFKEAIADYNKSIERGKDPEYISRILCNRGASKFNVMDYEGAYADQTEALALDSLNLGALNNIAMVCDEVGRPEETLIYLKKIIVLDPEFIGAYVNLGFKHQVDGKYEESLLYFDKAIELGPKEPLAFSNRAFSRLKMKDLDGALKDVNKSLRFLSTNSYAYKIRALIYIEMDELDQACQDLEIAEKLGYTKQYGDEVKELTKEYCKISKM